MFYYPWRQETELIGNERTYMSKFYVQTVVEDKKKHYEPDCDAVIKALEILGNNDMSTMHSYDAINDPEMKICRYKYKTIPIMKNRLITSIRTLRSTDNIR